MEERLNQYADGMAWTSDEQKAQAIEGAKRKYFAMRAQGVADDAAYAAATSELYEALQQKPAAVVVNTNFRRNAILRAVAIGMYILCVLPLIVLGDTNGKLGLVLMFALIAVATGLIVFAGADGHAQRHAEHYGNVSTGEHRKKSTVAGAISGLIWCLGIVAYGIISFTTNAWHITWLVFPICAAFSNIAEAIGDLIVNKEG